MLTTHHTSGTLRKCKKKKTKRESFAGRQRKQVHFEHRLPEARSLLLCLLTFLSRFNFDDGDPSPSTPHIPSSDPLVVITSRRLAFTGEEDRLDSCAPQRHTGNRTRRTRGPREAQPSVITEIIKHPGKGKPNSLTHKIKYPRATSDAGERRTNVIAERTQRRQGANGDSHLVSAYFSLPPVSLSTLSSRNRACVEERPARLLPRGDEKTTHRETRDQAKTKNEGGMVDAVRNDFARVAFSMMDAASQAWQ